MPPIPLTKWAAKLRPAEGQPQDPPPPAGTALRDRRLALGLTQYDVAAVAQMRPATLRKIERGLLPHGYYRRLVAAALDQLTEGLKRP